MDLAALRPEYMRAGLHEKDLDADPLAQFGAWFEEALRSGIALPNAMTLATATKKARHSARIVLLKGGDGGYGNLHYKSSTNRAPRRADKGWPGEELWVWLRLKLIADVGLVGLPNAGKSTFLSATSNARPKIADYPFTTLHPGLGVVKVGDREFVMADIPGLIEGASEGAGLGTRFLGHVERCRALLHLVDGTQDDVVGAYRTVRAELRAYGGNLARKKEVLALNKTDAMTPEDIEAKRAKLAKVSRKTVHVISAVAGHGVQPLLHELMKLVDKQRDTGRTSGKEAA